MGIGLLLLVAFAAPIRSELRYAIFPQDEGLLLVYPTQILQGAVPNHSFDSVYGIVNLWVVAGAFRLFGATLSVERSVGILYRLVLVSSLVTLAWRSGSVPRLPAVSGFLVPRCEHRLLTGCTVLSAKWPHVAAPGEVVLRASTGRYGDERSSSMSDGELVGRVVGELRELIGASGEPLGSVVQRA